MIKLTNNFLLNEFTKSKTASLHRINNTPSEKHLKNIKNTAFMLQKIRDIFNAPIHITSGYRNKKLNDILKGSKTSQHMIGEAVDIVGDRNYKQQTNLNYYRQLLELKPNDIITSNSMLFLIICTHIKYFKVDQIIHEYGKKGNPDWIHVSTTDRRKPRNEILLKTTNDCFNLSIRDVYCHTYCYCREKNR